MNTLQHRAAIPVLIVLCAVLATLQYRWIAEIGEAERDRLQEQLRGRLDALRTRFDEEIGAACSALQPDAAEIGRVGAEAAYAERYRQWTSQHRQLFRRIAIATPHGDSLNLTQLDLDTSRFHSATWPAEWSALRERLLAHVEGTAIPPAAPESYPLLEMPRFGGGREQDWLVVELNMDFVRATLLPELLHRYLSSAGSLEYDAAVQVNDFPIFETTQRIHDIHAEPDGSITLLQGDLRDSRRQPQPPRPRRPGEARAIASGPAWTLFVRHKAGSLEALVAQARRRNLAVSAGLLLLIVVTAAAMVRYSRQAQRLAELQINFVAGVSHEFRTPLTVIRTAAYNLRGRLASRPEIVERYGTLIQDEAEKLQTLVEQVLRFASTKAGKTVHHLAPVDVGMLLAKTRPFPPNGTKFETHIDPSLPPVLADEMALQHALQNLVDNALKYGSEANWVGLKAAPIATSSGPAIEIRVADHGPGIPTDEQAHIFDPFYRGRQAVGDQIHGTGLGLALVKSIVEAHGGTIRVESTPGEGAEFILQLPAAV